MFTIGIILCGGYGTEEFVAREIGRFQGFTQGREDHGEDEQEMGKGYIGNPGPKGSC